MPPIGRREDNDQIDAFGRQRRGQRLEVGVDGAIAGGELWSDTHQEFEILLEDKEMFRTIVAGQRGDAVSLGRADAGIATRGEALGVALAGDDVAPHAEPGHPGDVADDERAWQIHRHERLWHALGA